jgi:O-antigen ligase
MALIALARLWEGKKRSLLLWGLLPVSLFALVLSQARTAVLAFLAGVFMLLWMKPGSKILRWTGALFGLVMLGLTGFYGAFWEYLTRGQSFDPTLTGRTTTWQEAWNLFLDSPLVGFGFQADRIFPYSLGEAQHAHNAIFQALIQAGLLGTVPFVAALVIAWILVLRLYRGQAVREAPCLPLEIPALLAFVTVSSITESTFALYSTYWLMLAPCFAYLQVVTRPQAAVKLSKAPRVSRTLFRRPGLALPKIVPR